VRHIILIKKVYCQIIDGKIDGFLSLIEVECFDSIPIAGQYLVFLIADTKWGPTVGLRLLDRTFITSTSTSRAMFFCSANFTRAVICLLHFLSYRSARPLPPQPLNSQDHLPLTFTPHLLPIVGYLHILLSSHSPRFSQTTPSSSTPQPRWRGLVRRARGHCGRRWTLNNAR
jgi:hypothetical protein